MTQIEFGKKVGIINIRINEWENDKHELKISTLFNILAKLELDDLNHFFRDFEPKKTNTPKRKNMKLTDLEHILQELKSSLEPGEDPTICHSFSPGDSRESNGAFLENGKIIIH
jgi:transcriptional regulator with XRE-family HTH domain